MRITESQLRKIVREEIVNESLSEKVTDNQILDVVSHYVPYDAIANAKVNADHMVKFYIENAGKIKIAQLTSAPRKWVLLKKTSKGRDWREAYYDPYVAVRTGTFDPRTYTLTTDPQVDAVAAKYVGGGAF